MVLVVHDVMSHMLLQIGLGVNPDEENSRVPIMAWNTCAYSIMTTGTSLVIYSNLHVELLVK